MLHSSPTHLKGFYFHNFCFSDIYLHISKSYAYTTLLMRQLLDIIGWVPLLIDEDLPLF